jgi:multidrug efflux pump subunit AcrA (membrane-fusion protein)
VYVNEEFTGKVLLVYPTVDPMTRSFKVEIEVPNNSQKLKPGMFSRVSMFVGEEESYIVPANTVLQQEGTNIRYVFVENNGVANRFNVTLGKRYGEKVEIISDKIAEGANIISEGHTKLLDGARVKVID